MPPKKTELKVDLPTKVQVGDLIRLKADVVPRFREDCKRAGWDIDPSALREVTRKDGFNPGGGERLFVDGPPFAYSSRDVVLAGRTEEERREMLRARGWRV